MYRRPSLSPNTLILSLLLLLPNALAAVTVYTNAGATTTVSALAAGQTYAGLPAYDPTYLTAPSPPSPPLTSTTVQLPANGQAVWDGGFQLSVAQRGNFLGFSVELSVASSLLGKDGEFLTFDTFPFVPFILGPFTVNACDSTRDSESFLVVSWRH